MPNDFRPPEELDAEALLEWHRVTAELEQIGTLDKADRAIITHHCQLWAVIHANAKHVAQHGAVVKYPNGIPAPGPWFKTMKDAMALDAKLLDMIGLTPTSRKQNTEDVETDISF